MPVLGDFPYAFLVTLAVTLGLFFGSFLNVVIHRVPRDESVVFPGSRCPGCGKPIAAWDNLPVVSWLFLRGRARCCKTPISARYPLIEALGGGAGWAVLETRVLALSPESAWTVALGTFALYLALVLGLIAAAFIDLEHMILPDAITLGGAALGLATAVWRDDVTLGGAAIGSAIGFLLVWVPFDLLYRLVRGHPGMGLGDAKLMLLAGAWFGWPGAVFALLAGSVQGTVATVAVYVARGRIDEPEAVTREREEMLAELDAAEGEEKERLRAELEQDPIFNPPEEGLGRARVPFGPFLVLAIVEYALFGAWLREAFGTWFVV